jgi:hypothetical protein
MKIHNKELYICIALVLLALGAYYLLGRQREGFEFNLSVYQKNLPVNTYAGVEEKNKDVTIVAIDNGDGTYSFTKKNKDGSSSQYKGTVNLANSSSFLLDTIIKSYKSGSPIGGELYGNSHGGVSIIHYNGNDYVIIHKSTAPSADKQALNKESSPVVYFSSIYIVSSSFERNTESSYDNYDHYNKKTHAVIFYGPNGETAKILDMNGIGIVMVTDSFSNTTTFVPKTTSAKSKNETTTFYEPNGGIVTISSSPNGGKVLKVTDKNGNVVIYTSNKQNTFDTKLVQSGNGYIDTSSGSETAYPSLSGGVNNLNGLYNSALPKGVPKRMIPPGDEDLYILKSEIVPPVCPVCPPPVMNCPSNNDVSKCPPCPAPERCPEPSFTCQKVPNYNAGANNPYLPVPVLNSFSTFGM